LNFADPGKLPLAFEPNAGQTGSAVRYMAHADGGTLFFTQAGVVMSLRAGGRSPEGGSAYVTTEAQPAQAGSLQAIVRLNFLNANPDTAIRNGGELAGKVNYLYGSDPRTWRTNLPTYADITYSGLYSGVDLTYSGDGRSLKGTYTVAAGADPASIRWQYGGVESVSVDGAGNLRLTVVGEYGAASLVEKAPVAWQTVAGQRVPVQAGYSTSKDGSIGFALGRYDRSLPLTIDPTIELVYSSYLGGSGSDTGNGIAADDAGNAYITGQTGSADFPDTTTPTGGAGGADAFVTKIDTNAAGNASLVWSTYLGGSGEDAGNAISIDDSGNLYVAGQTASANFPAVIPVQPDQPGIDAFLTRFDSDSGLVLFSSYVGGNGSDVALGVAALGDYGFITGYTTSSDYPTAGAFQATREGSQDAFVTRVDTAPVPPPPAPMAPQESIDYSSYLGGSLIEQGNSITVDADGNAYVTGYTLSGNFPTTASSLQGHLGVVDAFVTRVDPTGDGPPSLTYSTYLGGTGDETGTGITDDEAGRIYVTGITNSNDFPKQNSIQNATKGGADLFLTALDLPATTTGTTGLAYSTLLGGSGNEVAANSLAVDDLGNAYVTGATSSSDYPVQNQLQTFQGGSDAFVTRINTQAPANSTSLDYSTFFGGPNNDLGQGIAVDGEGNAYITGRTDSANLLLVNQYQSDGTGTDAFVARFAPATVIPPATFTPIGGGATPTATACPVQFSDVPANSPFYTYIRCLACRGIVGGYGDGTFRYNEPVTRGQIAKIVANAAGFNEPIPAGQQSFQDVPPSHTFYVFIERLYARGVVDGYGCGTTPEETCDSLNRPYFRPGANLTRGQLTKIVANAAEFTEPVPNTQQTFADVPPDYVFWQFIERLSARGVINGYTCGIAPAGPCDQLSRPYFLPLAQVTRGQSAKIVANTFFPNCQTPARK
jgi:hypothetical protein